MGNSIDIKCAMLAMNYENYLNKKATGEIDKNEYTPEQLKEMIDTVRAKNEIKKDY